MKTTNFTFRKSLYIAILAVTIMLVNVSCKTSNKELILGTWELVSVEPLDKANTDEKMKEDVVEYIKHYDFQLIYFGTDSVFLNEDELKEQKQSDNIEYRIIKGQDFSKYPNFEENENGNWIALVLIEEDGNLYTGTNIYDPCEIVEISNKEMSLIIHGKHSKMESVYDKFVIKYKRVNDMGE